MALEHRPPKVVTLKGQKKVKCRMSGDKSQITVVGCVSAVGQAIPPYVIFKAKTHSPLWMKDGIPGTGYACSENGWIDTELFHLWLSKHIIKYAVSSRPLLLVLDGHSTHYQPETVQFAKQNGIIMFCLPPDTTHVSQPLDTCVFRPLKKYWNDGVHAFLSRNPGKTITKYNISSLLREAWSKAMTQENICAGFCNSGIYPFNRNKVQPTIMNNKQPSTKGNQKVCYMHIQCYISSN